ncbi:hypothetical protein BJ508DRAFT_337002, partial [Ascobolus immersus RN42]
MIIRLTPPTCWIAGGMSYFNTVGLGPEASADVRPHIRSPVEFYTTPLKGVRTGGIETTKPSLPCSKCHQHQKHQTHWFHCFSDTNTNTERSLLEDVHWFYCFSDTNTNTERLLHKEVPWFYDRSKASTARVSGLDNGPPAKQLALSAAASSTQLGPCEIPETQYPDAVQGSATTSVESEVAGGVGDAEGAGSPEEEIFHDALQLAGETEDTKFGILDPFTDNEEERRLDREHGVASEVDEEEGEPAWRRTGIVADSMATGTEQEESDIDDDRASPLPPKWSRHHPDNRHS